MADVKWIKIATDIFDNRKIEQIQAAYLRQSLCPSRRYACVPTQEQRGVCGMDGDATDAEDSAEACLDAVRLALGEIPRRKPQTCAPGDFADDGVTHLAIRLRPYRPPVRLLPHGCPSQARRDDRRPQRRFAPDGAPRR